MGIYVFLVFLILSLNIMRSNRQLSNKIYTFIVCTAFILVTGLRASTVGSDTWNYYANFYSMQNYSFSELVALNKRDFGYYILQWCISRIWNHFNVLTVVAAVFYYVPMALFIYENSDDIGMSYLILMAFNFFQFSMTGIRQTIAFGCSIMFIREIMKQKKSYIKAFFWIMIGISMHKSCAVVLAYLPMKAFQNRKSVTVLAVAAIPVAYLLKSSIAAWIIMIIGEYSGYTSGGGITTYLVYLALLIWGLLFTYNGRECEETKLPRLYLLTFIVATALQGLVSENSILFRLAWYFSWILVIYLPRLVATTRTNRAGRQMISLVVYAALLFMYFGITMGSANVVPYVLFSNEVRI